MATSLTVLFQNSSSYKIVSVGVLFSDNNVNTNLTAGALSANSSPVVMGGGQITMHDATYANWNFVALDNTGRVWANSTYLKANINPSQSGGDVTIVFDGAQFYVNQGGKTEGKTSAYTWCTFQKPATQQ